MNTLMWDSPVTLRHLRQLLEDRAAGPIPAGWTLDDAPGVFARHAPGIILVPPQAKRLACGDVGVGAMAEVTEIAEVVRQWATSDESIAVAIATAHVICTAVQNIIGRAARRFDRARH